MAADARERLTAEARRAQILRCATTVFARSNYRVAGMAEIAKEAGISEPTVYKHFPSKKALFLTILERVGDSTLRHWQEIVASSPDPLSAIRHIGVSHFEIISAHPDTLKVQFQALSEAEDPEIRQTLRKHFAAYADFISGVLERGKADGHFRADLDARAAAWQMISIGFTLNLTSLLGFEAALDLPTLEVMGDNLVVSFGAALEAAPPSKERVRQQ